MSILPSVRSSTSWSVQGIMKEKGTDESLSSPKVMEVGPITCVGGGDVVGVVTPLVGGEAQAFHDDQVVELPLIHHHRRQPPFSTTDINNQRPSSFALRDFSLIYHSVPVPLLISSSPVSFTCLSFLLSRSFCCVVVLAVSCILGVLIGIRTIFVCNEFVSELFLARFFFLIRVGTVF